jgi:hypothetical protein
MSAGAERLSTALVGLFPSQLGLPPCRIDIMTTISGVDFAEAQHGALEGTLFDVPVRFIGREALVRNKLASGRPKGPRGRCGAGRIGRT